MDFSYSAEDERFRRDLRAWLAANRPTREERVPHDDASLADEFVFLLDWQRRLWQAGYVGILWPAEYGGRGARATQQAILNQELARARAPQLLNRVGINNTGPTLIVHGSEAQKKRFLPKILSGEEIWCQLFSEPNAGSDLAALRTRAEPDGDRFLVSGQKVWTSYAQLSKWAILLARTDPALPKHRGLTFLILDMESPGITVRPLRQITGSTEFSEVFLDAVPVPREHVVGAVNQGWEIAMTTLAHERGTGFAFKEQVLQKIAVDDLAALARARGRARDPIIRQEVARGWIDVEIMGLMNCRTLTRLEHGEEPGPESSLVKLFWAGLTQRLHELALELEGPRAQLVAGSAHAIEGGRWQQAFLWSRVGAIAGGTSEVQANIVAQRILGLPR
jgi:alkylation response protein AidB-like acyl-CoA dehydrogenase